MPASRASSYPFPGLFLLARAEKSKTISLRPIDYVAKRISTMALQLRNRTPRPWLRASNGYLLDKTPQNPSTVLNFNWNGKTGLMDRTEGLKVQIKKKKKKKKKPNTELLKIYIPENARTRNFHCQSYTKLSFDNYESVRESRQPWANRLFSKSMKGNILNFSH